MRPSVEAFKAIYGERPAVVLECGVLRGAHSMELYKSLNIKELYLLDQWRLRWEHYDYPQIYDYAMEAFKAFDQMDNVFLIRADALKYNGFKENQFDFIYLDDNHTYEHVLNECEKYIKYLKPSGVLAGDNYTPNGRVERAVKEFCQKHNYTFYWKERKKAAGSGVPVGDWWIVLGERLYGKNIC